ncbi:bifunctional DNA primase/polymerase [Acidipropionibacterium jensenii]|uniref:bifunctional DNA primase/polymerase n=1 Tax=Acidipropionibacterium jensenii TaxID=1749 RepID=UPI00214B0BE0|nr:bifunctional DNA primase/polymerase [Acidipropionibacterium jensenii]
MATYSAFTEALMSLPAGAPTGEAAYAFAASGVPVFPVAAGGKQPLTRHGFHDATTDPGRVRTWWSAAPAANIGMPTGAASGLVVVDVDVHGPANGYVALDRADRAGLLEGWELLIHTPSDGLHAYYPASRGVVQRSWQAARAGIDFRGDGGYIIVPPSRRLVEGEQHAYRLEQVTRTIPQGVDAQRLRRFLDPPPARTPIHRVADRGVDVDRLAAWAGRLQEGERNHGLFWAACTMAEHHVPAGQALDVLTTAGGQAGLSVREVTVTVRSAYRTIAAAPTSPAPAVSLDRSPPAVTPVVRSLS